MDAGYGADTGLRTSVTELGLRYVAGIQPTRDGLAPGTGPLPPKAWSGRGRPPSRSRRDGEHRPIQVKALALACRHAAWQTVTWREGSADWLSSRYARLRVRAAHRDERLSKLRNEEWLLVEWPEDADEPTKYWLSTLPARHRLRADGRPRQAALADRAGLQELKQELGLGHYEGRGWRGFHHHATLCIAAYGFLVSEREPFPPRDRVPPPGSRDLPFPKVTDPEAPPIRPERHIPDSIATLRRRLTVALARTLRDVLAAIPRSARWRIPDY